MKNQKRQVGGWLVILLLTLAVASCEDTATNDHNRIREADSAMAVAMYQFMNASEPSDLDGIDFTTPNRLYRETIAADPTITSAHLGAAITEIMKLNVDQEIRNMRDDFENYFDTADFWGRGRLTGALKKSDRKMLDVGVSPFTPTLRGVDPLMVVREYRAIPKVALGNPPLMSEVQALIQDKLMPAVTYAIGRLEVVEQTPTFTYTVTPQMQGNYDRDPRELDMTEVKAFHGGLLSLRATLRVFNAYDFDVDDYTADGIVAALQPGTSFFTLNSHQELPSARTDLMDASDILVEAVDFLQSETDNQDNDIIKFNDQTDLQDIRNALIDIKTGLENSVIFEDFNDGLDLTVSFKQFFTNPIQDFKTKLPAYTVSVFTNACGESELFWKWNSVIFPDPHMNNIFPDMASSDQFKETFDIEIDTAGHDYMTAFVGGLPFEACDMYGYGYTWGTGGYFELGGDREMGNTWEQIHINTDNFTGVGTYPIGGGSPGYANYYRDSASVFEYYSTDATHTGVLEVTFYDSQTGLARGTFSFTAYNSFLSQTKSITGGQFLVRLD